MWRGSREGKGEGGRGGSIIKVKKKKKKKKKKKYHLKHIQPPRPLSKRPLMIRTKTLTFSFNPL